MPIENNTKQDRALVVINAFPEAEHQLLLNWANQVLAIRAAKLPVPQKLTRIISVTRELGMAKPLLVLVAKEVRRMGWDERSKPMRGVIGGAGLGLAVSLATPMAGLAAFGGAIAVPVVLLGAAAGALLTAIVDELTSKK